MKFPALNRLLAVFFVLACALCSRAAHATDGCKVALCLGGNWRNIAECRPEVEQAMHDVERGRGWPTCDMGGGNGVGNGYIDPSLCPDQYKWLVERENGPPYYQCQFSAVVDLVIDGQLWTRLWWSPTGDSVTQWMPAARTAFAGDPTAMDDRFDRDYAAWLAAQPLPTPPGNEGNGS